MLGHGKGGLPGTPGSGGPDVSGSGDGPDWSGWLPSGGSAMDPKAPTGERLGARGGTGRGAIQLQIPGGYGNIGWHGGLEAGISGGSLPSRAVLAGGAWRALHPGRDASDDPKKPDSGPDGGTPPPPSGTPPQPPGTPPPQGGGNPPEPQGPPLTETYKHKDPNQAPTVALAPDSYLRDIAIGATIGAIGGYAAGEGSLVLGGIGLVVGGGIGAATHYFFHMPADDGTGPVGPRTHLGTEARFDQTSRFLPSDDVGSPTGPRSSEARMHAGMAGFAARARDFMPPPDGPEGGGPSSRLYMPNPEDPTSPGNPHSREAATISRAERMR